MMYPPSAQFLVPVATTRKYRPLPFRPSQSHDRNGISSLPLSYTPTTVHSQRTNGSSTKASKRDDIVEARVLSDISGRTPPNGIIISSYNYGGSR
jgi:hypothetical protein